MLKKVLCMTIVTLMAIAAVTVLSAGATNIPASYTEPNGFKMGDVDYDNKLTIKDSTAIQKTIAALNSFSDYQLNLADVDENGVLNIKDATMIRKHLAGITESDIFSKTLTNADTESTTTPDNDITAEETTAAATTIPETTPPETTEAPEVIVPEETEPADEPQSTMDEIEKAVAERFIGYVNEERKAVGVQPLKTNNTLTKAAKLRSNEIIVCWSHDRPDGTNFYTAIEDPWSLGQLGENIACNGGICHFSEETLEEDIDYAARFFFGQFKSSPGHYSNMINDNFTCTGVGVEIDGAYCYMAHMFASVDA